MMITAGMRTDIPAFYSEWFLNRIREGYVLVRNPYRPDSVTRYELNLDVVDALVFCTKNPTPMLPHLQELHHQRRHRGLQQLSPLMQILLCQSRQGSSVS